MMSTFKLKGQNSSSHFEKTARIEKIATAAPVIAAPTQPEPWISLDDSDNDKY